MCSLKKNYSFNIKILIICLQFVIMIQLISCSMNSASEKSIIDQISWDCANNASCVNLMSKNVINSYKNGEPLNFGLFSLEKLEQTTKSSENMNNNNGRAISSITDFLQGNIIKFPIGPMVFSISRAEDDNDYIELALLKKSPSTQGRRHNNNNRNQNRKDKKQMQMFIPMYLAATTFGWTLFAVKSVAILTIKALLVSKLAFLVAVGVIIKKVMDSASEKMLMPQHQPYMMPYHMDYGMHGHAMAGSEMSTNDFYNLHVPSHQHHQSNGMESMSAESNLAHAIEIQANATQPQILAAIAAANAAAAAGGSHKIKRNDSQWTGVKSTNPLVYSYLPNQQQVYVYRK